MGGKSKIAEIHIALTFEVKKEQVEIEITYYLKNTKTNNAGIVINHVVYMLTISFIVRKQYKSKTEITGGVLFGF